VFILFILPTEAGFEVILKRKDRPVQITLHPGRTLQEARQMIDIYKLFFECESVFD
jgi:hypothetical protein